MQCSGLCEPEHAVHGYLMCDVRWHALQRQHMSGKGSNLVTPRALFFCSSHLLGAEVWLFFFLWYGRSRSKARSLHEKKLLLRKLLHGHRWSHAAWQIIKTKTQTTKKNKARRRSPSQICVSPSKGQQSKQRTGQEPNRNNHKRFAKDTVVKTHCVATDSKTCSKRISCHPVK